MEVFVVIVIIGILATLGITHYGSYKERTLDKEAQANLRLIKAAEKIYKMENSSYYPTIGSTTDVAAINDDLRLQLTTTNWNYKIDGGAATFTGKAQRVTDATRIWCINQTVDNPYTAGCSW